jgi:branched-chain amino acid transport system ATP-binding protein
MLEMDQVCAGYGGTAVLHEVNLVVPPGSIVALLGANGAGKTTLLRVASGLLRPTGGHLRFDGQDITKLNAVQRARLGICHIPEGRSIFPGLSVRENLALYAPAGQAADAVEHAAEAFPVLKTRSNQLAGTLSGGEQQMLALARAYIQRPRLALLDEVSMGLAPLIVDEIFAFIQLLASQGASVLLVEQYVRRALDLCDHVFIVSRGAIDFAGEPGELTDAELARGYLGTSGAVTAS